MKTYLFLSLALLWSITSCQESKNRSNSSTKPLQNSEKILKEKPGINKNKLPTYTYSHNGVDEYNFDYPIDYIMQDDRFVSKFGVRTLEDEGEKYEVHYLEVSDKHGKLFDLIYDHEFPKPTGEEFILYSERLKNSENIGVGNTYNDFIDAYPQAKIYFSYMGEGEAWLSNGYKGSQFVVEKPKNFFDRVVIDHDGLIEIDRNVFDGNEKIKSIRIFGASTVNVNGIWSSGDHSVTASFTPISDHYHTEISTGDDIYNQFSQDLIPFYDLLYSHPTERIQIEVDTSNYPNYIVLTLDDHEAFEPMKVKLFPKQKHNLQ